MIVKFIFDDDSELIVTDYKVDKTTLVYGDEKVVITCVYEVNPKSWTKYFN